ncbi:MAG: N-acetylmuramic acid 6-phosphate etherase [Truepera sp.]|nr:N-acetylmuramic acid 6-phosphate etherase [Truepera sp.]
MTEAQSDNYRGLDTWPSADILKAIVVRNQCALNAVEQALPTLTTAALGIERAIAAGGRLIYLGAGTSGRLALQDAAELPPTFGFDGALALIAGGEQAGGSAQEGAEDDELAATQAIDMAGVSSRDAVIGIAASGTTPYTVAGIRRARARGAFTVGIANNPGTPLLDDAEVGVLLDTGPEVLAGSTRLAAGTAQKVALNALSTAVMVHLGGAYDNLMVGMRPSNAKLRRRAAEIVQAASGSAPAQAQQALMEAGGKIREAIVMVATGASFAEAQAVLARHHRRVREALAELSRQP